MAADYMSTYFATFDLGSWDLAVEELVLAEVSILEYLKEYARIYSERGSPFPGITILA